MGGFMKIVANILHGVNKKRPIIKAVIRKYVFQFNRFLRKHFINRRYSKLRELKNTKKGRCFIIGTGPSLTKDDMNKLKHEDTFGMNSLVKWFPEIGWETTYYGIQDYSAYKILEKDIFELNDSLILFSLDGQAPFGETRNIRLKHKKKAIEYPLYYANHLYNPTDWNTKLSDDASDIVYNGYSVAFSLLQIAIYMGYNEIYLLGIDCNYNQKNKHAIERGDESANEYSPLLPILGDRMIYAWTVAQEYAKRNNIKIYNATRGGMLEVFPRIDLDSVIERL